LHYVFATVCKGKKINFIFERAKKKKSLSEKNGNEASGVITIKIYETFFKKNNTNNLALTCDIL
jgi:hypothetical protein